MGQSWKTNARPDAVDLLHMKRSRNLKSKVDGVVIFIILVLISFEALMHKPWAISHRIASKLPFEALAVLICGVNCGVKF